MEKNVWKCSVCGAESVTDDNAPRPSHCGKPMQLKEDHCTSPTDSEWARGGKTEEPCDDGRKG